MADVLTPLSPEHSSPAARASSILGTAQQLLGDAAELLSPSPAWPMSGNRSETSISPCGNAGMPSKELSNSLTRETHDWP